MNQSASKSSLQVLFGSFTGKLINLVVLLLATPILGPEGFGQLLIVGVILGVFNTIIDIGFEGYYIFKVRLDGTEKNSVEEIKLIEDIVFTLRLYTNLILFILQIGVSYLGKDYLFSTPVDTYLRILSLNYLLNIFGAINEVRLKKRMEFKTVTRSKVFGDVFGAAVKLFFVYIGFGIIGWAYGLVASTLATTAVLIMSSNYRPNLITIPAAWRKEVMWYAKHSWVAGLGQYLDKQIGNIILNFYFPLKQVGYIQFSNSYALDIQASLLTSQISVLFPYYANFQHDRARLRRGINQFLEAAFFIFGFPAIFGMIFGQDIIRIFFGDKWLPAYPIFGMYCANALLRVVFTPCLIVLTSLGKMKEGTIVTYINFTICTIALLVIGFFTRNIYWYAFVFVVVDLVKAAIKSIWGLRFLKISLMALLIDVKNTLICLLSTFVIVCGLFFLFPADNILHISICFVLSGLAFISLQYLLNRKVYSMFYEKVTLFLPRFKK
ncbi:MAG TPA: oligosaccharide flippase family protein [Phnomibacter sp.]|nr:oligosaccharide flippase family protein [Phnomibacter sp.]